MELYFHRTLASSTQKTYKSAQNRYLSFCANFSLLPVPVSEQQLCRFVTFLAEEQVSHATIKCYLSAIRWLQIGQGLPDPLISDMPKLEGVVRGIKTHQARKNASGPKRLPITSTILQQIHDYLQPHFHEMDTVMIWAAASTCFFGFLRAGELTVPSEVAFDAGTHLCFADLSIDNTDNPTRVTLHLKASKTDPFRKGVDVVIGRTFDRLCPVTAILTYVARRGNDPGLLFRFQDGRLLTKQHFVQSIREALLGCGLNPNNYSGHSFRIGAATTAGTRGLDDSVIMMLGRWKSAAYQRYIRTPKDSLARFSAMLGTKSDNT